jgi:hypothetical protein
VLQVPHNWYIWHRWKAFKDWLDVAVVVLKFHPLCYFHIYLFGVALAAYYLRLRASRGALPWVLENGAVIAYTLLALGFSIPELCPPSHKLLCRLGGLAPLQGLLLVGLSEGRDPVARLLQHKLFAIAGAWSFGIYILHFEVLALWGGVESGRGAGLGYWVVLLALAALAHHYVQVPWGTDLRLSLALRLGAAGVFVVCMVLSSVPDYLRTALFQPPARRSNPAAIVYRNGAVDFRLELRVPPADAELAFIDWMNGGKDHVIINPTLAQDPSDPTSVWVAARLHRKDVEKHMVPPASLGLAPPAPVPGAASKGLVSKAVDGDALGHGRGIPLTTRGGPPAAAEPLLQAPPPLARSSVDKVSAFKEYMKSGGAVGGGPAPQQPASHPPPPDPATAARASGGIAEGATGSGSREGVVGATRQLLAKLVAGGTQEGEQAAGAGGPAGREDKDVSVTILKWNSRIAVGVMDLAVGS